MSDLRSTIKDIQRHLGLTPDGVFGPMTASAVRDALVPRNPSPDDSVLDARTVASIKTLDVNAQAAFMEFALLAKATAATLGCDYVMIGGHRTWGAQDKLYAQGRTAPGDIVTNAKGGYSNHNFAIAGDFGVFRGGIYLDEKEPATAAKIHKACSEHAKACGLEWGGSWKSLKDLPHYEIPTGLSLAAKRKLFGQKGSVL